MTTKKKPTFTRGKKQKKADNPYGIFPSELPYDDPEDDADADQSADDNVSSELRELRDMVVRQTAQLEQLQSERAMLMAQPAPAANPTFETEVSLKDLPDPMQDPEGYAKELASRTTRVVEGRSKKAEYESQQAQTQAQRLTALWDDFKKEYPQYAAKERFVKFAAEEVAKQQAARGVDVQKYVFGNTKQFMKDVVAVLEDEIGPIKAEGEGEEDDEADEPSTVGIFGGTTAGNKPVLEEGENGPSDMFSEIRDWQVKTGYHR